MKFVSETFDINLKNNFLIFSGNMELLDYKEVDEFLKKIENNTESKEITIDLKNLFFLNSSGIRTLAVFVLNSEKVINFLVKETSTWQKAGITPIVQMKKSGQIIISD